LIGVPELNCWIAAIPCEWYEYQGVRLRVRDDVNNWTRSDNLAPGEDIGVEIDCPTETIKWGQMSVTINAEIVGNTVYSPREEYQVERAG